MNLSKLFEMQKVLDERIIKEHGLKGKDLLPNTVLALQVEIGEMVNEWNVWKHWKTNPQPKPGLLGEYVDCLHFFLSIARQIDLQADELYTWEDELEGETTILLTELLYIISLFIGDRFLNNPPDDIKEFQKEQLRAALFIFFNIGEQRFDFTFEQIAQAYMDKNKVNHERQDNHY